MKLNKFTLILFLFCIILSSCTTLKPYERIYVNDPDMQMGTSSAAAFEKYTQTIREGSVTADGQKGSGGCGCN